MRKRFRKNSGDAYQDAQFTKRDEDQDAVERRASARKAKVWEVWHKADNKVYWVTEGGDVFLDSDEPHLKLSGFFPCPSRSEEHTSELQSLMRTSYAVFCLKTKITNYINTITEAHQITN